LVEYRGLFLFLVWRDIKVRYTQTVLGVLWAVLQPLLMMVIFSIIFGRFARLPSDGVPYPLFALAALVPWTYFSTALGGASNSLIADQRLVTKVYFPRLIIPAAPVLAGLVDLAAAFAILLALLLFSGIVPHPSALVIIPLLVVSMVASAAGLGCWLAALNIQYRDVRYAVPFLLQCLLFASPIAYPMSLVPERFQPLYALNPMVGVIEGFRMTLFSTGAVPWSMVALSCASGLVLFVLGTAYFRTTERVFADVA
jgi:lipopolysaccharide transport system permease protein